MTNKVAEKITNKFLEAIKASGKLPWQKPWRSVGFANATTGREYSGVNVLTLALFGNDTDFITFNQAKDNGGFIRKGSKGLPICYFKFMDKKDASGNVITRNGKNEVWPMLRYSTVFNLSDVDGCDALKAKALKRRKVIDFKPIEACEKLASTYEIAIKTGLLASYLPVIHAITMPAKETFKSEGHYYCTLFHELGHSLSKELGEDISNGFGSDPYASEELVAELFANFCLSFAGVDSSELFNHSAAYLQKWTSKLTSGPTILISASSRAFKRFQWLLSKAGLATVTETEQLEEIAT